jgi:hypothetical protein
MIGVATRLELQTLLGQVCTDLTFKTSLRLESVLLSPPPGLCLNVLPQIEAQKSSEASDGPLKLEFQVELHAPRRLSGHRTPIEGGADHSDISDVVFMVQDVE